MPRETIVFEVPNGRELEVALRLVEMIRRYWGTRWRWIEGKLSAPNTLLIREELAEGVRITVYRDKHFHPEITGPKSPVSSYKEVRNPNLSGFLQGRKPQFIEFNGYLGSDLGERDPYFALDFLNEALLQGYLGPLLAWTGKPERGYPREEWIDIYDEAPGKIVFAWMKEKGGRQATLQPFIEECQRLGLKELQPQVAR